MFRPYLLVSLRKREIEREYIFVGCLLAFVASVTFDDLLLPFLEHNLERIGRGVRVSRRTKGALVGHGVTELITLCMWALVSRTVEVSVLRLGKPSRSVSVGGDTRG